MNVYPTQIEDVLKDIEDIALHYLLVVSREGTLDTLTLRLELSEPAFYKVGRITLSDETVEADLVLRSLRDRIQGRVKDTVGVNVRVSLLAPGAAPRSAGGKLRRTLDERNL